MLVRNRSVGKSAEIPKTFIYACANMLVMQTNCTSKCASLWHTFVYFPIDFYNFFLHLCNAFGSKFIGIVFVVYGLNQGLGEVLLLRSSLGTFRHDLNSRSQGWLYILQKYYFKDILKLSPSESQLVAAVTRTPWNIKVFISVSVQ